MLHKIWIILRSEYWRRVRSKTFILTTLLLPFGLVLLMVAPGALGYFASQSSQTHVVVVDDTGVLLDRLHDASGAQYTFTATELPIDSLRRAVRAERFDGYLVLPDSLLDGRGQATYYASASGGFMANTRLENLVEDAVRQERLARENASSAVMGILESDTEFVARQLTDEGSASDTTFAYAAVGWAMAFLIYFAVFFYGQYVMQGVIEEKNSRVVEIVVSSVRPFELLMGKVLGIGAMGLTQFVVWSVLVTGGLSAFGSVAALMLDPQDLGLPSEASQEQMIQAADISLPDIPADLIVWFVLFFIGGYLLYASLFAAAGSAVEQQQDAQSFVFPLTLPLIVPILFLYFLMEAPDAPLSVGLSLVPFFSPVLMVARAAITDVPFWQMLLAFGLLVGTFVGTIWVSSRIYRVGILMYGKKPTLRELLRWTTY